MELVIRAAQPGDLELVPAALGVEHYQYLTDQYTVLGRGRFDILFAFPDGQMKGVVVVSWARARESAVRRHLPGVPMIAHLYVEPSRRGEGIGRRLIEEAEALLRRKCYKKVLIGIDESNHPARAMYEHLGYVRAGRRRLRAIDLNDGSEKYDIYVAKLGRTLPAPQKPVADGIL